jgi:anti-sigma regulatory factor (Ser/Thr protein kinase)
MSLTENGRLSEVPSKDCGLLRECYPAVSASVPAARRAICEFAASIGADPERLEAIALAVSEAVTNVVQYAYPWRLGHVHVTARTAGGELWILIADSGCGIHAGRESEGLGLGLALISALTDGFSVVERSTGGTELRLRFTLKARPPMDDGEEQDPIGPLVAHPAYARGSVASVTRPASSRFSTTT